MSTETALPDEDVFRHGGRRLPGGHAAPQGRSNPGQGGSRAVGQRRDASRRVPARSWPRRAWPASPGRPSTAGGACPGATSASTTARPRPSRCRPGRSRSASACADRRSWSTPARSRSRPSSRRCCGATTSGASCSASPERARTSRACRPGPDATATSSCVDGQKVWTSGAQHSDYAACLVRTDPAAPSARASRCSSSTCTCRASRCGRCARSPANRTSTRSSSTGSACRWRTCSARSTTAGGWRAPCWPSSARRWGAWARAGAARAASAAGRRGAAARHVEPARRARPPGAAAHPPDGAAPPVRVPPGHGRRPATAAAASVLKLAMAQLVQESALGRGRGRRHACDGVGPRRPRRRALVRPAAQLPVGLHRRRAPTRSCATSSPNGSSACPATRRATSCRATSGRGRWPVGTEQEPILRGLRVVEIGQYVAAPLAATIFADLGAEVVKVERPGGDPLRADPARFAAWNRGKRTVELDLRSPGGARRCPRPHRRGRPGGREPAAGRAGRARAGPAVLRSRTAATGDLFHQRLGERRAVAGTSRDGSRWSTPGRVHSRGSSRATTRSGSPSRWPAWPPHCWPCSAPAPRWSSASPPDTASTSRRRCSMGCSSSTLRRSSTARATARASSARPSRRSCASSTRPTAAP